MSTLVPAALLGVELQSETAAGSVVVAVARRRPATVPRSSACSNGPAEDAGIETGDVIVSLGDATITSSSDLSTTMDKYHAGDKVDVGWTNASGSEQHATLKLTEGPPA